MRLTIDRIPVSGEGLLLRLRGAVDQDQAMRLDAELEALRLEGPRVFALDLAEVRYIGSTGLGVLVKHAQVLDQAGGGLFLLGVQSKVRIVIEMLGLERAFDGVCDRRPRVLVA